MRNKSQFTLIERCQIYTNALKTFISEAELARRVGEYYPFGLCSYVRNEALRISHDAYLLRSADEDNFPEFYKQKPFLTPKLGFWWGICGEKNYQRRVTAMTKSLVLINKKIANERKRKGPMVLGDTSQPNTGQSTCTVLECN